MEYRPRTSIRLRGYDYSKAGIYIVTICSRERKCLFGQVVRNQVRLSELGYVVRECWMNIPDHFSHVRLDAFVVMPNHLHGILILDVGAQHAAPLHESGQASPRRVKAGSLAAIVRSFKSAVANTTRKHLDWVASVWQRNYYEHIVRNGEDLEDIRRYIRENPLRWAMEEENPHVRADGGIQV